MTGFQITKEGGKLVARGSGDKTAFEEAVRSFVLKEISAMPTWLSADDVEKARIAGSRLAWHLGYGRLAWPDTDPPLEIVDVWRTDMLRGNAVVFYRCQKSECLRCHDPGAPWSSHLKTIRADGLDAVGAGVEVEVRHGKKREAEFVLVDQPVFVAVPT